MLLIPGPACGLAAPETEFQGGGQAHVRRAGPEADDDALASALFERANPRGPHLERWRHLYGCGRWFNLARDTVTMEILGAYAATEPAPPPEIAARIAARRNG